MNAQLQRAIRSRIRLAFGLSGLLLTGFLGYLLLLSIGAGPAAVDAPFGLNLIVFASLSLVVLGIVASGVYVYWANRYLDPRIRDHAKEAGNDG